MGSELPWYSCHVELDYLKKKKISENIYLFTLTLYQNVWYFSSATILLSPSSLYSSSKIINYFIIFFCHKLWCSRLSVVNYHLYIWSKKKNYHLHINLLFLSTNYTAMSQLWQKNVKNFMVLCFFPHYQFFSIPFRQETIDHPWQQEVEIGVKEGNKDLDPLPFSLLAEKKGMWDECVNPWISIY